MKIRKLSWILIGGVTLTVLLYAGFLMLLTWPINEMSVSTSGVFGDSFGVLTSLFSGLAFAGLIITIVMQRDELALQRKELSLTREELSGQKKEMKAQNSTLIVQRFENTFFKMLEFLDNCRKDIFYQGFQRSPVKGRDAIKNLYELFVEGYLCKHEHDKLGGNSKKLFKHECASESGLAEQYNLFYKKYGDELGQYFRTLYNLLKLVELADYVNDKSVYTNLVRAQLSRYELSLLFYNSLSDFGSEKMAPLVKKYKLLKHLEVSVLPTENIEIWNRFNS